MWSERGLREVSRAAFYASWEWLWTAGLFAAARVAPSRAPALHARGGDRVLVVAPHPDDETAGAGGTLRLHIEAGDAVTVVVVTDGSASRSLRVAPEEMARLRAAELAQAMRVLEVDAFVTIGLDERAWRDEDARAALARHVAHTDIVYAPCRIDFHPDHLRLARVVASLVRGDQVVRGMELGVPLTTRLINRVADVSRVQHVKDRALDAFRTQQSALLPIRRLARYRARRLGHRDAEAFWELDGAAFTRVTTVAGRTSHAPFRGVRVRPVSDPLCWLAGTRERRRLHTIAGGAH